MEDKIYANVASELEEIFKYMDKTILDKIPTALKEHIHKIKNPNYNFEMDKSKELIEQDLLLETKQILSVIFIKYCCTDEETMEIFEKNDSLKKQQEESKIGLETLQNAFNDNLKYSDQKEETNKITRVEEVSWYSRIINKIKSFFKIKK